MFTWVYVCVRAHNFFSLKADMEWLDGRNVRGWFCLVEAQISYLTPGSGI